MPIDNELRDAVHQAVVQHLQPLDVERQLLALLNQLSEQELSNDRRMQSINMLQAEMSISKVLGHNYGN